MGTMASYHFSHAFDQNTYICLIVELIINITSIALLPGYTLWKRTQLANQKKGVLYENVLH